jgi:hypothetical protein
LSQGLGPAKPFNKAESSQDNLTSKLYEDLKKVISNLDNNIKENIQLARSVADLKKAMTSRKSSSPTVREVGSNTASNNAPNSALVRMAKITEQTSKSENKFYKAGLKKGSIYTHDIHIVKELEKLNEKFSQVRDCLCGDKKEKVEKKLILPDDGQGFSSPQKTLAQPQSTTSTADAEADLKRRFEELYILKRYQAIMGNISKAAAQVQIQLMGFTAFNKITEDLVEQERKFAQEVRQVAFETMGVTKENRTLQHTLTEIGNSSAITGMNRTETQKSYVENLKKGLKDQKTALKVSKTQLHTEKMIGLEAGGLGDSFSDMSLHMNMSNDQMDSFSRGIKEVARDTGVTGKNLSKAVQGSESIMKNYRNAANFNADAAKSAVGIMASADKFGVSEGVGEIMSTVSQGLHGITNASKGTQTLLYRAATSVGKLGDLQSGTWLQTKEGMKGAAQGIENIIRDFSGRSIEDVEKMGAMEKSALDNQLRQSTGRGLGELMQMNKAFVEQGKTLEDKLKDINKERKKNLTIEEQKALDEQERSLKVGSSLDVLTKLGESAKDAKNMGSALANFQQKLPGMKDDLNALGINNKDAKSAGKEALKSAIDGVNQGLKKAGKKELKVSTKDLEKAMNDPTSFRSLTDQINEKNKELGVAQKSQTDVLTDMNQTLTELNETLRGRVQGFLGNLLDSTLGKFMYFTTAAAGGMLDVGHTVFDTYLNMKQAGIANKAALKGMGDLAKKAFTDVFGYSAEGLEGFGTTLSGTFGPEAMAGAATALRTVAMGTAAVIAVAGAIYGSISAGEKAAELFGKQIKEVTMAEFYAAKGAGAITGALNFLTFGIFDSFLGSTGVVTKWLAEFNKMIPILSAVMAVIDIIAGAIWGVVLSVKDVFVGAFEMIYLIIEPFIILIKGIGEAIGIILSPLFSFNATMEETGSLFQIFTNIFGVFGKAIRGVMRAIGFIIGGIIKIFVKILIPVIKTLAYVVSIFTNIIGAFFQAFFDYGLGVIQVFEGLFTLDFGKIAQGLWRALSGLTLGFSKIIWNIFSYSFKLLFIEIPKLMLDLFVYSFKLLFIEIPKMFLAIPGMIYEGIKSLAASDWVGPIFQPFLEILKPIQTAISSLYNAFGDLWTAIGTILDPFYKLFNSIFGGGEAAESTFNFMDLLKGVIFGLSKAIGLLIRVALFPLQIVIMALAAPINAVAWVINQITKAIQGLVSWANNLVDSILSPFEWLYDVLVGHSIIPDLVTSIISLFGKMAVSLIGGFGKMVFSIVGGVLKIPGLITSGISASLNVVTKLSSDLFSGFSSGFASAQKSQIGFFASISRGFQSMANTATMKNITGFFGNLGQKAKDTFKPFSKGYTRSRESGEGVISSMKRGGNAMIKSSSLGRSGMNVLGDAASKTKGVIGGLGGKAKGIMGGAIGGVKGLFGSLLPSEDDSVNGCCAPATEAIDSWSVGMNKLGKQNADSLTSAAKSNSKSLGKAAQSITEKSSKGLMSGFKDKIDSGIKSGKGLLGGLFGKATDASKIIPSGNGVIDALAGKGSRVSSKVGSMFSKGAGLMGSLFGKSGNFIAKVGLGGMGKSLLKKLPGIGAIAGAGFAISSLIQGNVGGAITELASGLAGAIPIIGPVLSMGIDLFGSTISEGAGWLADKAWSGAKSLGTSLYEGASSLAESAGNGAKWLGSKLKDGASWLLKNHPMVLLGKGVMNFGEKLWEGTKSLLGFNKEVGSNGALQKAVGPISALDNRDTAGRMTDIGPPVKNVATTASNLHMQSAIQREIVSSEPANKIESSDLGILASEGKTQTEQLTEAVSLLQQIADSMKDNSSTGVGLQPGGDTSTSANPSKPVNNYPWQTGKQSQLAGRGLRKK